MNLSFLRARNVLVLMFCTVFIFGCSENKAQKNMGQQAMQPLPVNTLVVKAKNIPIYLEYPARVKSVQQVQIVARVTGTLEEKFYTEGSAVKKGDLLYKIDPKRYQAAYDSALASLAMSDASLKETSRNFNRVKSLFESNALSQKEFDAAISAYENANASVQAAKAAVSNAKIDLDYTEVRATATGISGLNIVDIGSYVGASTLLTTITQVNPVYVEFSLSDVEMLKKRYILSSGDWKNISNSKLQVSITTPDGETYPHKGTLDFFDNIVDSQTASIKARATFENPDSFLIPGLFVRISIDGLVQQGAFVIPQEALMQDGVGMFVFINNDNTVAKLPVNVGISTKDGQSVIDSGLKGGEVIILNNLTKLRPGSQVVPNPTKG